MPFPSYHLVDLQGVTQSHMLYTHRDRSGVQKLMVRMIQIRVRYELMAAIDSELDNWCIYSWLNSYLSEFWSI